MTNYASGTTVSKDRSLDEIKRTLVRYGADAFRHSEDWAHGLAVVEFAAHGRHVRFSLPMPSMEEFTRTERGRTRTREAATKSWEQACRQRWRALALAVKAKLEAVESGIATFEREFLAYVVDPESQRTVGEVMAPQLEASYAGDPRPLLLTDQR